MALDPRATFELGANDNVEAIINKQDEANTNTNANTSANTNTNANANTNS